MDDDLADAARAAVAGDPGAFHDVIRLTQADVWRLCAFLVDRQSADDLTQETYVRACRSLPRFRGDGSVLSWLLTLARRVCAAEIDSRQRARELSLQLRAEAPRSPGPDPTTRVDMDLLIAGLEPDRRLAFVLTQVIGCDYAEAAAISDCPVGTIRSRVARARDDLVQQVAGRSQPSRGRRQAT